MYDNNVTAAPPAPVSSFTSRKTKMIPEAEAGDIVLAPHEFVHPAMSVNSNVVVPVIRSKNIDVGLSNVEAVLADAETNRLKTSVISSSNFVADSITTEKLSAPIPVSLGGTGINITEDFAGRIGVGNGSSPVTFTDKLTWSNSQLNIDADVLIASDISIQSSNEDLVISGVKVGGLGKRPTAEVSDSSPLSSEALVNLNYSFTSTDSNLERVFIAWYASGSQPRLHKEIADGTGSIGHSNFFVDGATSAGSFVIDGLVSTTDYDVKTFAVDKRGNFSDIKAFSVSTGDTTQPVVISVHSFVTSPTSITYSSSNAADATEMLFVSGLLTTNSPLVTKDDVLDNIGLFYSSNIPAGQALDVEVTASNAADPTDSFSQQSVVQGSNYYPFVFYLDGQSNYRIQYGSAVYNPDTIEPYFLAPPGFVDNTVSGITVSVSIADSVQLSTTKAYVSILDSNLLPEFVPDASTILAQGTDVNPSGNTILSAYHSSGGGSLDHSTKYNVYIAANDASGNTSAVSSVTAWTRDDSIPIISTFDVNPFGSSNVNVVWESSDYGHGVVTKAHVVCSTIDAVLTPEQVRDHMDAIMVSGSNGDITLSNVNEYEDTHVYVVVEDDAMTFGNPSNKLSAVSKYNMIAPVITESNFTQSNDDIVAYSLGVDESVTVPATLYYAVFLEGEEPTIETVSNVFAGGLSVKTYSIV